MDSRHGSHTSTPPSPTRRPQSASPLLPPSASHPRYSHIRLLLTMSVDSSSLSMACALGHRSAGERAGGQRERRRQRASERSERSEAQESLKRTDSRAAVFRRTKRTAHSRNSDGDSSADQTLLPTHQTRRPKYHAHIQANTTSTRHASTPRITHSSKRRRPGRCRCPRRDDVVRKMLL
jgi:hypothetical protein